MGSLSLSRTPSDLLFRLVVPWKAIGFAIFLFLGGSALLIVGALILAGYITQAEWVAKGRPFIILGSLMFIPGFYHVRLAYYAWKGYEGYDFEQIPDYDD